MIRSVFFISLFISIASQAQFGNQIRTGGLSAPVLTTTSTANFAGILEYLPPDYTTNPTRKYPLLIFLHGAGEQGTGSLADLNKIRDQSPKNPMGWIYAGNHMTFTPFGGGASETFIVVAPQMNVGAWNNTVVNWVLNEVVPKYASRTQTGKVFVTGLSLGGEGCYNAAGNGTSNVITSIIVCGGYNNTSACTISSRKISVWGFHGTADATIAYSVGRGAYDLTVNCTTPVPIAEMKFNQIVGGSHSDSWDQAYRIDNTFNTPNIYEWMLSKTKL